MGMKYGVDVEDFNFGNRVRRTWSAMDGVGAITMLAAPGAGYQYLILSIHMISDVDSNITIAGYDTTERVGAGAMVIPLLGKLAYDDERSDFKGLFRTTANTALTFTPSVDAASGVIEITYLLRKTEND